MIDPKMIPDEVVEELHAIFADDFGTLIPKGSCRAAITAALVAWPGVDCRPTFGPSRIILPLPQEKVDD